MQETKPMKYVDRPRYREITQNQIPSDGVDPTIWFGPLSTSLSSLFSEGFTLEATADMLLGRSNFTTKVHLRRDRERYLVFKIKNSRLLCERVCLSDYVKNNIQMLKRGAAKTHSVEENPWETLLKRHPSIKKQKMVGNQTLKEYVRSHL